MSNAVATGIHINSDYKLGAAVGKDAIDERTPRMADFLGSGITVPPTYDFDANRKPFPKNTWGNTLYGDCECAGAANYMLRLQRAQTSTTPGIDDDDVIARYKAITGCQAPGDANDTGMTTVTNLTDWYNGWVISKDWQMGGQETRDYKLSAFGYGNPQDEALVRLMTFIFTGTIWGVALPTNAQDQVSSGVWDVDGDPTDANGPAYPGSWGGHCVYSKRFDADNLYLLTWGMEMRATNRWINTYAMECYSAISTPDPWFSFPQTLNIQKLLSEMQSSGITAQT